MHNQYTDFLLRLPDVKTKQVLEINESTLHIEVTPIAVRQACPCCQLTEHVIRKGQNRVRRIRHLGVGGQRIYLLVPAIRLFCKSCDCGFVWNYSFVDPGKRYTKAFEQQALQTARVATVKQSAELHFLPNSTLHHKHEQWLAIESKRLQKQGWKEAASMSKLVLGIDDFAIRKGQTYNTGIHNLRGETLLDIFPGRRLDELRIYAKQSPAFLALRPVAVVMDLAPYYHTWIRECFPEAIRVADRFHVQRYVVEAVQSIRKSITPTLAPQAKAHLKAKHRLLNPRVESLSVEKQEELRDILGYSALLKQAHAWKESFSRWYDCSPNVHTAKQWLHHWLVQGKQIQHPAIMLCLKTIKNWKTEILNYHRCRGTNAAVEGRNNRIKAFQRRHYFTRNRERYVQGLLVECNYAHYG